MQNSKLNDTREPLCARIGSPVPISPRNRKSTPLRGKSKSQGNFRGSLVGLSVISTDFVSVIESYRNGQYTVRRLGTFGKEPFSLSPTRLIAYIREHKATMALISGTSVSEVTQLVPNDE